MLTVRTAPDKPPSRGQLSAFAYPSFSRRYRAATYDRPGDALASVSIAKTFPIKERVKDRCFDMNNPFKRYFNQPNDRQFPQSEAPESQRQPGQLLRAGDGSMMVIFCWSFRRGHISR